MIRSHQLQMAALVPDDCIYFINKAYEYSFHPGLVLPSYVGFKAKSLDYCYGKRGKYPNW